MGKVKWEKPNAFTYCAMCQKNEKCKIRSNRRTAGCADGKKENL